MGIASVIAIAGAIFSPSIALAGLITINLPADIVGAAPGSGSNFHNVTADGFRFSPSCHFDEIVLGPATPGIGWDRSGCGNPGTGNPDYLGPPVPIVGSGLYVDDNGTPFGLVSIERIGEPFFAESSKGAIETINPVGNNLLPSQFDFTGSGWSGISWVFFFYNDPGAPAAGFDQMVVDVAEPPAIAAFGAGLLLLGCVFGHSLRRRRQMRGSGDTPMTCSAALPEPNCPTSELIYVNGFRQTRAILSLIEFTSDQIEQGGRLMFTRSLAIAVGLGLSATAAQAGVVNIGCASATCSLADLIGNPGAAIEITGLPNGGAVAFENFTLISNSQTSNLPGSNPPAPNLQAIQVIGLTSVGLDILGNGEWSSAATEPKEIDTFLTQFSYQIVPLNVSGFNGATLQTNMSGTQNGSHQVTESVSQTSTNNHLFDLSLTTAGDGFAESLPAVGGNDLTVLTTVTGSGQRPFEGGDTVAVNSIEEVFIVPEPATSLLFLSGVMGLLGIRRWQVCATDEAEGKA